MNSKIGKERAFKLTIGRYSLHETTYDNGTKLIYLATSKGFRIMNTIFPHKDIQ